MLKYFPYIRSSADFKTIGAGGNLINSFIWNLKNASLNWIPPHYTPEKGNSVFIEEDTTLNLTADASVKDLNLNGNQDVVRLNTQGFKLDVWGKMRTYTGPAPGTTDGTSNGAGIAGFVAGTIRFRGSSDRVIVVSNELSANSRIAGWTMEFAFDEGITGIVEKTIRCGHLIVTSGILETATGQEVRPAGDDYSAQPGNGISGGTVLIKSGAVYKGAHIRKNSVLDAGNCVASFTIEEGGIYEPNTAVDIEVSTLAYNLLGIVKFGLASAQEFLNSGDRVGAIAITDYGTVWLAGSGNKTLYYNTLIKAKLIMDGTASLNLGGKTLSYGANADLEYIGNKNTAQAEFPDAGDKPRNIISNGGILTLDGNKIIRGKISLVNGGSIDYNGFTITEGDFVSAASGSLISIASWNIYDNTNILIASGITPEKGNDLFIEAGHTITLTQNAECKDLNVNVADDVIRIDTSIYFLDIYGKLRSYSGVAPGTSAITGGIAEWVKGKLRFKGSVNRVIVEDNEFSADADNRGWDFYFDFDNDITGTINESVRFSNAYILSGVCVVSPGNSFRPSGNGDPVAGSITVYSGAKLVGGQFFKSGGNPFFGFTLQNNSELEFLNEPLPILAVSTGNLSLLGKVIISGTTPILPNTGGRTGCENPALFTTLELSGSGTKALQFNTTVNSKLIIKNTVSLSLNGYTLTYGPNADLEYIGTFTSTDSEFPSFGSLVRNIIVNGGVLTLNGDKEIRGKVILLNGGTIDYNGFTITEGVFVSLASGDYTGASTWGIYDNSDNLVATDTYPSKGNDIWLQNGFTVTLDQDSKCRNLNINSTEDVVRLNYNNFSLEVYGETTLYTGTPESPVWGITGTSDSNNPLQLFELGGESGKLIWVGDTNRTVLPDLKFGANRRQAENRIELQFSNSSVALSEENIRLGELIIHSGVLNFYPLGNVRLDTTGIDGEINGTCIIKSGGVLNPGSGLVRISNDIFQQLTVEDGGELRITHSALTIDVQSYDFTGIVHFNGSTQNFPTSTKAGSAFLSSVLNIDFGNIKLSGSGAKTLLNNITINTKLEFNDTASLNLNSKTLTYGANAILEYKTSMVVGDELTTTTKPFSVIIADGITLDMGGKTITVSGTVTLGAGASIINGTLSGS